MNLVIFGPPGAGKGTQSNFIVEKFKFYQLSTGELLRKEVKSKSKLGMEISSIINSGSLVSDQIVSKLIENYLSNDKYKNKLIFDGYPRNLKQANNLDNLLKKNNQKISIVLNLSVSLLKSLLTLFHFKSIELRTISLSNFFNCSAMGDHL